MQQHQNRKLEKQKLQNHEITRTEEHQGIIPSSSEFAGYENTLNGAADRILKLAEKQQEHLISIQNKALDNEYNYNIIRAKKHYFNDNLRVFAALFVCLIILAIGAYTIAVGQANYGTGLIVAVIVGVIVAFIKRNNKE